MNSTMRSCLVCGRPVRVLVPGTEVCRHCRPVMAIVRSGARDATETLIRAASPAVLRKARDLETGRPDARPTLVRMIESELARRERGGAKVACRSTTMPLARVARTPDPALLPQVDSLERRIETARRTGDFEAVTDLVREMNRLAKGGRL